MTVSYYDILLHTDIYSRTSPRGIVTLKNCCAKNRGFEDLDLRGFNLSRGFLGGLFCRRVLETFGMLACKHIVLACM